MSKPKNNNNDKRFTRKVVINLTYIIITILTLVVVFSLTSSLNAPEEDAPTYSDLISEIRSGNVSEITVSGDKETITAQLYNTEERSREDTRPESYPNLPVSELQDSTVQEVIETSLGGSLNVGSNEGEIIYTELEQPLWQRILDNSIFQILIYAIIIGIIGLYLVRRITDANSKTMSFGSSRARSYDELENKDKISFKDVAGQQEAKEELLEVVDFLKRPEEYQKMGAKIPRGVLLFGLPGNGKTLMAKAIAGEAEVPFLYVSGSEFVEMFVGVGAGRVRDLFRKAKKKAPCVIFIDEIDAVGRQRGVGSGGGNDEREQTLNQILVEMDGFEPNTSVIVVGATNRPDVLDPALLRPGRFDRQVTVTSPDKQEREQILEVHSKNKILEKDADLGIVARRTAGFSGADLMNVLNEAAILTVREKRKAINNETLREAVEKVVLGPQLKSKVITGEQKKLTAYHEAGHALTATVLPKADKVQKVTIIPRGKAGGYTFSDRGENDAITRTKTQFYSDITVLFGGYVVEEMIFGEVSTGASNDLAKATEIARNMVTKYGMSSLGPVSFAADDGIQGMGRDGMAAKSFSPEYAKLIDKEVTEIIDQCYKECKKLIKKYESHLHLIANTLIESEVLELEEFNELVMDIINPKPDYTTKSSTKDKPASTTKSSRLKKSTSTSSSSVGSRRTAPAA
jgi:cell division protease FtsH